MISIDFLYTIIGTPLGYIMWPIYLLLQNFGWAILIFTVIVKIAMLPLQIKQQKNMAFSQLFAPKVKEIQQKYRNNRDKQAEEMQKLQAQGYNTAGGRMERWLTGEEVCGQLRISPRTLQTLRDRRLIGYSQINRRFYYKPEEVKRLIPLVGTLYPGGK